MKDLDRIRNFVIIAHIDHGKSTLADRMLELTGTISPDQIKPQMLDTMELERERGITIKLQPVTMAYRPGNPKHEIRNSKQYLNSNKLNSKHVSDLDIRISDLSNSEYILNLIDTPGHVDFSYEVSRSLAAVEGAVLVVDATKGIQAQTLANLFEAQKLGLKIIPVINKIDLEGARIPEVTEEISDLLKIEKQKILKVSAKTGENVEQILEKIVDEIPAPNGSSKAYSKALIFDSVYDSYRGVIAYVRIVDGSFQKGDKIQFLSNNKTTEVLEVGNFRLKYLPKELLGAGEIGYIVTGTKDIGDVKVGDTVSSCSPSLVSPIPGFKIPLKAVFASFFSADGEHNRLKMALEKLKLNDSSLSFEPESSTAFGMGFRLGCLGLLHLEIIKERLEREYNLDLIITQPSVLYKKDKIGAKIEYEEPWVRLEIITPQQFLGPVMELIQAKRGIYKNTRYLSDQIILEYEAPLSELIVDFYDKLKAVSSGYASQNYELIGWRKGDLAELEVLVAGEKIDEFSRIVPRLRSDYEAKKLAKKLKELIPRQMFEVSIQVAHSTSSGQVGKILARENISSMKKDVTAKLYGGDVTRKNKLLKKQAAGKKKMKQLGRVQIPNNVFIDVLKS